MVAIFADSNRARIRAIREDTSAWGVTPVSGVTRELRYTSSSVTAHKNTVISEEIRADRMVPDHIEVGANSQGDIGYEFSAGSHDDLMESFMYGTWTRPMTFDSARGNIQWGSTSVLYVNGEDVHLYFTVGHRIRTKGFLTPANNNYWQISAISWNSGANRTEITVTTTTSVVEVGGATATLHDANDVIVLKSTAIRAGTTGASAFDSNGGNAFAAAIAAGQLVAGQKIFVEGLGFESGLVTLTTGDPTAGARVTIGDGVKTWIFQFGGSGGNSVTVVPLGGTITADATALKDAINAERVNGNLDVSATSSAGVVTIKNLNSIGGSIVESVLDANVAVTNFSGGDASVRGLFTIVTAADDVLTVTPAPATNANGGSLPVTIKGSMLRNPSNPVDIIPQSYTLETGFEDVNQFFLTNGLRVGTFSMNFAANQILTGQFAFNGAAATRGITTVLGNTGTYTVLETTSTPVMNSTVNVGYIKVNGTTLTTAIQSIDLSGTNNLRDQNAVSYKFPAGIGAGRMEISGSLTAYFADGSLWDKFIQHDTMSLEFNVVDVDSHRYEFTIPAVIFSNDDVSPSGGNQDIMEKLEWMAKRDPTSNCQIQIDRFSCTSAPTA